MGADMEAGVTAPGIEAPAADFKRRRWYHRRDLRFVSVIVLLMAVFHGYGFVTGPAKISGPLAAALDGGASKVNIQVVARFPPEAFHISIYQEVGSMRGSNGKTTILFGATPEGVRLLSRKYWIEKIDLVPNRKSSGSGLLRVTESRHG